MEPKMARGCVIYLVVQFPTNNAGDCYAHCQSHTRLSCGRPCIMANFTPLSRPSHPTINIDPNPRDSHSDGFNVRCISFLELGAVPD